MMQQRSRHDEPRRHLRDADSLDGAPAEYLTPEDRPTLDEARAWCHQLATSHYENFHVATFFLPRRVRPHFESLYAFCRVSDDLGDEVGDTATALRLLETWGADARPVLRRARAVAPSRLRRAARDHRRLRPAAHPLPRSAARLHAGPDQDPLRHVGRGRGVLALLGEPRGPAGADGLRIPRRAARAALRQDMHRRCNWPTSGRTRCATRRLAAATFPPSTCSASAWPRARSKAASSPRSLAQ